jgi:hypothetical protein
MIILNDVRLSFPVLFTPAAGRSPETGEPLPPKYSCQLIVPKDHKQMPDLVALIKECAREKWNDKAEAVLKMLKDDKRICLRDADNMAEVKDLDYLRGMYTLSASARESHRPLVINRNKSPLKEEDGVIYPGCYVNARISFWAQDHKKGGKRINANIHAVQFVRDGESFATGNSFDVDDFPDLGVSEGEDLL